MRKLSHITLLDQYAVDMDIVLGKGSTGCVYQGLDMKTGRKVAIKIIDLRTIDNQVAEYLLNMEKIALMSVRSPYVLQGLKVTQDNKYCFMVTQYCNGGTLKKYIKNSANGFLDQQKALKIVHYLLLGYRSLIQKGIIHRDLKPANIMFHDQIPKIIDFGYCQIDGHQKPSLQYNVGSPSYMAPQSFQTNIYNQKTQIWGLGVILFQCLSGKTIDQGRHMSEVYRQIQVKGVPFPNHIGYFSRGIINWCLNKNPKNRPTCAQLIEAFTLRKNRSKSKLSPHKKQQQYLSLRNFDHLKNSSNLSKVLKQSTKNNYIKNQEPLIKSTKIDPKKSYRFPEFLQSHNKQKTKQNNTYQKKLVSCYSTRDQLLSSKIAKNGGAYIQNKQNARDYQRQKKVYTHLEYGHFNQNKNYFKGQNQRKINVNEMYEKICNNTNNVGKNRVLSTEYNNSPCHRIQKKTPSKLGSVLAQKQYMSRSKRTFTERGNLIRA